MDFEKECKMWKRAAYTCQRTRDKRHTWIPAGWTETKTAKHITMLLCTSCFHTINVSDMHKYKDPEPIQEPTQAYEETDDTFE